MRRPDKIHPARVIGYLGSAVFLLTFVCLALIWTPDCLAHQKAGAISGNNSILNPPAGFYTLSKNLLWILLSIMTVSLVDLIFVLFKYRRTEEDLKESMAQSNLLLNSAAEGIYGLDLEGNCTFCNPACLNLLGFEQESELLGVNLHQLIHHTRADGTPYLAEDCKICHAYQNNTEIHLEDEVLWRKDGSSFPVEYWSYPLRRGNKTVGAVVSFLDITDRKSVEQKLLAANQELDAFVYTVSHDLRTPISAVVGYTDLIKEAYANDLSEDVRGILDIIEQQGDKMSLLVEDLLALARAGNIDPPLKPIDAAEALSYVLTELEAQITGGGVKVVVEKLPHVMVPETLLIQIFENLIGNALRYAGDDGGLIEVGGERTGTKAHFYVSDHGQGVPKDEQSKIFDVFYRGSTGKKITGSGVGLATVQKIARLYNGQVSVEDTPGGGATFRVELEDVTQPGSEGEESTPEPKED
jgi:PAS domain S-box-containing protein